MREQLWLSAEALGRGLERAISTSHRTHRTLEDDGQDGLNDNRRTPRLAKSQGIMSERPYDDAVLVPPEPRARSPPDDSTSGDRKRRRKVLSCFTCRRRKLQCDRVSPTCGRCKSAGQCRCLNTVPLLSDYRTTVRSEGFLDLRTQPKLLKHSFSEDLSAGLGATGSVHTQLGP